MIDPLIKVVPVGTRIWFAEEKKPYRVRARCERYLVCTKPFNPRKTVLYTVVDLEEGVRGTENLVFGFGAETDQQCEEMIKRLQGIDDMSIQTEVSHRNRVPLDVVRIETP